MKDKVLIIMQYLWEVFVIYVFLAAGSFTITVGYAFPVFGCVFIILAVVSVMIGRMMEKQVKDGDE